MTMNKMTLLQTAALCLLALYGAAAQAPSGSGCANGSLPDACVPR
jgi:hypothetical protein